MSALRNIADMPKAKAIASGIRGSGRHDTTTGGLATS